MNDTNFTKRKSRITYGEKFEDALFDLLKAKGFEPERIGIETFKRNLPEYDDTFRFRPDFKLKKTIKNKKPVLTEAKGTPNVNKSCWYAYNEDYMYDTLVIFFFKKNHRDDDDFSPEKIFWNYYEEVELIDGNTTVARYRNPYPVDDDGWICQDKYGSGEPYRVVNFNSLRPFSEFTKSEFRK